jgi:hypothetical protein
MDITSHHIAYSLLVNDFRKVLEYVHPAPSNFKTYSHRIYELFFRTCTEFENACKELLLSSEPDLESRKLTIKDYRGKLYEKYKLYKYASGLKFFDGQRQYSVPFQDWSADKPLSWYQAYNHVKHNRSSHFHKANLINLVNSLAGLTIIEYKMFGTKFFTHGQGLAAQTSSAILIDDKPYFETDYGSSIFTIASLNRDEIPI